MKGSQPPQGKIITHSNGMGVPSPELVRSRARELARIDGRSDVTEEDWKEAKRELRGGREHELDEGENAAPFVSERDMVAPSAGSHSEKIGFDESDNVVEELVAEGMDEAVHEQMLEGCKPPAEDVIEGL